MLTESMIVSYWFLSLEHSYSYRNRTTLIVLFPELTATGNKPDKFNINIFFPVLMSPFLIPQ